jgi:hypothetical protein
MLRLENSKFQFFPNAGAECQILTGGKVVDEKSLWLAFALEKKDCIPPSIDSSRLQLLARVCVETNESDYLFRYDLEVFLLF